MTGNRPIQARHNARSVYDTPTMYDAAPFVGQLLFVLYGTVQAFCFVVLRYDTRTLTIDIITDPRWSRRHEQKYCCNKGSVIM